jgi:hypothetical protein
MQHLLLPVNIQLSKIDFFCHRAKRCKTLCAPDSSGLRWLASQSRSSFNMVELVGIEPATS